MRLYISTAELVEEISFISFLTTILPESTFSTVPLFSAITQSPESLAINLSIPVPTRGASVFKVGTACLIMLEPIKALLASSCSRKGIRDAAIDTTCCGDTSISSTLSADISSNSFLNRTGTSSSTNLLFLSSSALACAITNSPSSIAEMYLMSSVTLPLITCLYGVSINPKSLTLAKTDKEFISPILGPSGVSIGQTLP